jgi:hypothetical protein
MILSMCQMPRRRRSPDVLLRVGAMTVLGAHCWDPTIASSEHQENIHFYCEGVDMAPGSVRLQLVGGKRRSLSRRVRDSRGNLGSHYCQDWKIQMFPLLAKSACYNWFSGSSINSRDIRGTAFEPQRQIRRGELLRVASPASRSTGTVHFQSQMMRLFFVHAAGEIEIAVMQRLRLSLFVYAAFSIMRSFRANALSRLAVIKSSSVARVIPT